MNRNVVIETNVVTDLPTEPVALDDVKRALNLLFETSGSYTFSDDDTYITGMIKAARIKLEKYVGMSFGVKTIRAVLRNECGNIEIPLGPIDAVTSVKDANGTTLTATITGDRYKKIKYPCYDYLLIDYTTLAPTTHEMELIKQAIVAEAVNRYKHRGDEFESKGICTEAKSYLSSLNRIPCLA